MNIAAIRVRNSSVTRGTNESWGVPNLPDNPAERHASEALYHLTGTLDVTRPVIGNDGWESVGTDIIGVHDYDHQPERMARQYHADEVLPRLFKRERSGGRLLLLEGHPHTEVLLMLDEFGGLALAPARPGTWGYSVCATPEEFAGQYERILHTVRNLGLLAGFCDTEFSDTFQAANGLLYADRTPKIPNRQIANATTSPAVPREGGLGQVRDASAVGETR